MRIVPGQPDRRSILQATGGFRSQYRQPLPAEQIEEMEEVFDLSALPVIADESCLVPEVDSCIGFMELILSW